MSVSVVVPTYNAGRFIIDALVSVFSQTVRPAEVIVVDDGSTDDTVERLEPFRERIRYFYQPNSGVSTARNRGILASTGTLVALLDADDVWLPHKLESQLAHFQEDPEIVLVYTDFSRRADLTQPRTSRLADLGRKPEGDVFYELLAANFVHTSSVVVRRNALAASGIFDPELRGPEDRDLWLRLARIGKFKCCDDILVDYRLHDNNSVGTLRFRQHQVKAARRQLVRWGDDPKAKVLLQKRLLEKLNDEAYAEWISGNYVVARRAYWELCRMPGTHRIAAFLRAVSLHLPPRLLRWLYQTMRRSPKPDFR